MASRDDKHPPVTEEQLALFSGMQRNAVVKALRRWTRTAVLGYLILLGGVFAMYENGQSVSSGERQAILESGTAVLVDSCNRDYNATLRLRGVFERLITAVKEADAPEARKEMSLRFYRGELEKLPLPDCRKAVGALTADPDETIHMPKPLYPPDG